MAYEKITLKNFPNESAVLTAVKFLDSLGINKVIDFGYAGINTHIIIWMTGTYGVYRHRARYDEHVCLIDVKEGKQIYV